MQYGLSFTPQIAWLPFWDVDSSKWQLFHIKLGGFSSEYKKLAVTRILMRMIGLSKQCTMSFNLKDS